MSEHISYDKYEKPIANWSWQKDTETSKCNVCHIQIIATIFKSNKHHCRFCGKIICNSCSQHRSNGHRICDFCMMDKEILQSKMIKLSHSIPKYMTSPSNAMMINNNSFIFVADNGKIYKYNATKDKWTILQISKYIKISNETVTCNPKTKTLYSFDGIRDCLTKINLNNRSLKSVKQWILSMPFDDAKCLFINDDLHIIGGSQNNKHYIFNEKRQRFIEKHTFLNLVLTDFELIYLETKGILYLFGGRTPKRRVYNNWNWDTSTNDQYSDDIYKYNITTSKWEKLNVKLPDKLIKSSLLCTSCKRDEYIIIFEESSWNQHIYIFDVEQHIFIKSKIKCPIGGILENIKVFISNNSKYKIDMILSGYIHLNALKICNNFPEDLIILISQFADFDNEYVHVFGYDGYWEKNKSNQHWKISVEYILQNSDMMKLQRPFYGYSGFI